MAATEIITTISGSPTAYLPVTTAWTVANSDCELSIYEDAGGNLVGWDPWYALQINKSRTTCWPPQATLWWAQQAAAASSSSSSSSPDPQITTTTTTATTTTTTILGPTFTCPDIYYPALVTTLNTYTTQTYCCPVSYQIYEPQFAKVSFPRQCTSKPAVGEVLRWDGITSISGTEYVYATSGTVPSTSATATTKTGTAAAGDISSIAWTVYGVPINGENVMGSVGGSDITGMTITISAVGGGDGGDSGGGSAAQTTSSFFSVSILASTTVAVTNPSSSSEPFSQYSGTGTVSTTSSSSFFSSSLPAKATGNVNISSPSTTGNTTTTTLLLRKPALMGIVSGCISLLMVAVAVIGFLTMRGGTGRWKRVRKWGVLRQLQRKRKSGKGQGKGKRKWKMGWQFDDNDDKEKNAGKEEENGGDGGDGGCGIDGRPAELEDHKVSRKLVACGAVGGSKFVEHEMLGTIAMSKYTIIPRVIPKGGREGVEKGEEESRGTGGSGGGGGGGGESVEGEAKEARGNGERHELPATPVSMKWISAGR